MPIAKTFLTKGPIAGKREDLLRRRNWGIEDEEREREWMHEEQEYNRRFSRTQQQDEYDWQKRLRERGIM